MPEPKLLSKIIVTYGDKVLLVRRSKTAPKRAFDWELPGGIIEPNEDPKATAIRELEEETAIKVKNADYIFAGTSPDLSFTGFFFTTQSTTNTVKISYEHDDYKWVDINEAIDTVTIKGYATALKNLQNYKDNKIKVSTKAIVTYKGKILALRRALDDVGGGNWDLPGGALEPSEDVYTAIKREIKEETKLNIKQPKLIFAHTEIINNEIKIRIGQRVETTKNIIELSHEHDKYRWLNKDVYDFMKHPNWPGWGEFVKNFT